MKDTVIYCDSAVGGWHMNVSLGSHSHDALTRNINEFINSPATRKIAIFHIPFPFPWRDTDWGHGGDVWDSTFEQRLLQVIDQCEFVIMLCSELHEQTVSFVNKYNNEKIHHFTCGTLNNGQKFTLWMDWFTTTTNFYKTHDVLNQLTPYQPKPKVFDILLGQPKPHRRMIYDHNQNNLDRIIMTYLSTAATMLQQQSEDNFIWETEGVVLPEHEFNWTVTPIQYYGQWTRLSQVVPIKIYNQTAYTVVAETNFHNEYSFYTEKIVKPIMGRRLFLVFAGQYFLRNLRSMGFKTFDGIIDESYDLEPDFTLRGQMILKQMDYLFEQDQQTILDKVRPIAEYNYNHMMTTDWHNNYITDLRLLFGLNSSD